MGFTAGQFGPCSSRGTRIWEVRRRNASYAVSPGKGASGEDAVCVTGFVGGGVSGFGSAGAFSALESFVVGDNTVVTASAPIAATAAAVAANFRAAVFGDRRVCVLNHSRSASSETTTPILPSPPRIARIGAPSRRIFSSSVRCASSCEVLGFFGRRDSATNWASVGLAVGWRSSSGGLVVVKWREL